MKYMQTRLTRKYCCKLPSTNSEFRSKATTIILVETLFLTKENSSFDWGTEFFTLLHLIVENGLNEIL